MTLIKVTLALITQRTIAAGLRSLYGLCYGQDGDFAGVEMIVTFTQLIYIVHNLIIYLNLAVPRTNSLLMLTVAGATGQGLVMSFRGGRGALGGGL